MTSEMKTPWAHEGGAIRNSDGDTVGYIHDWNDEPPPTAYIIRAVNNHEALIKLAKEVLICVRDEDDTFDLKYEARKILASLEK